MSLERVVRPFQTELVFNARRFTPLQRQDDPTEVVTVWGAASGGSYNQFVLSGLVGGTTKYKEQSRVTEKVRVSNPDDDSQFVDVERIRELTLANELGNQIKFQLNP